MTSRDSFDATVKEETLAVDQEISRDFPSLNKSETEVETETNNFQLVSSDVYQPEQADSSLESLEAPITRDDSSTWRDSRVESFPPVPDFVHMETLNSFEQHPETSVPQESHTVNSNSSLNTSIKEPSNEHYSVKKTEEEATSELNNNEKIGTERKRNSGLYEGYTQDIIEQNTLELGPDMPRGETEDSPPVATKTSNKHNFSCKRLLCGFFVILIGIAVGLGVSLGLKEDSSSPKKNKSGTYTFEGKAVIQGDFNVKYDVGKDQKFVNNFCNLVRTIESNIYKNVNCQVTDISKGSVVVSFLLKIFLSHNDGVKLANTLQNALKEKFKPSNMSQVTFSIKFKKIQDIQTSKKPGPKPTTKIVPPSTSTSKTEKPTKPGPLLSTKPKTTIEPTMQRTTTSQDIIIKSEFSYTIESPTRNLTEVMSLGNSSFFEHMKALAMQKERFNFTNDWTCEKGIILKTLLEHTADNSTKWIFLKRNVSNYCQMPVDISNYRPKRNDNLILKYIDINSTNFQSCEIPGFQSEFNQLNGIKTLVNWINATAVITVQNYTESYTYSLSSRENIQKPSADLVDNSLSFTVQKPETSKKYKIKIQAKNRYGYGPFTCIDV